MSPRHKISLQLDLSKPELKALFNILSGLKLIVKEDSNTLTTYCVTREGLKEPEKKPKPKPNTPAHDWNPWEELILVFKQYGVEITARAGGDIAVVRALGYKVGMAKFLKIAHAYCSDKFYRDIGRSPAGFTKAFDKMNDRVTKTSLPQPKEEYDKKYGGPVDNDDPLTPQEKKDLAEMQEVK